MGGGPSISKAGVISTTVEGMLYGFSIFMFGMTMWILWSRRSTPSVNWTMVAASVIFAVLSTMHMIADVVRLEQGLIEHRDTPGGPDAWFADISHFTFVFKILIYLVTAVLGDAIVIYRCYMVWQSSWFALFPGLMITGVAATGIGGLYRIIESSPLNPSSYDSVQTWITAFYATTLSTNFFCTCLLAYRIWSISSSAKKYNAAPAVRGGVPVLMIVIDSGLLYASVHLITLVFWVLQNSMSYIFVDLAMPVICISFYMVIVRIGMAKSSSAFAKATLGGDMGVAGAHSGPVGSIDRTGYPLRPLEVHITQLTESHKPQGGGDVKSADHMAYDPERGRQSGFESESDSAGAKAL